MSLSLKQKRSGGRIFGSLAVWTATAATLTTMGFLAFAVAPSIQSGEVYADSAESRMKVNIAPAASIALEYYDPSSSSYVDSDKLRLAIDPDTFKTGAMRITAGTNSPTGMKLSMNDSDSNNALIEQGDSQSSPAKPVISSITTNTTIADVTDSGKAFSDNTWGYAIADTTAGSSAAPAVPLTYSQIPTTETQLKETETTGDSAYIFTAGVRVGRTLPAGTYKDQLTFTVIANPLPEPAPAFFTTEYMQDFNPTICATVQTPSADIKAVTASDGSDYDGSATKVPSTTIKDKRDEQVYTIRKLADGNCWMTENLRYGAEPQATPTDNPTARAYQSADAAKSDNINTTNMAKLTADRISNAPGCGSNFSDSTTNYTTPSICIYQANTAADYDGQTKYGVLYNYCAATGGTVCNQTAMSADAAGSVCPKGWKLPGMTASATGSGADTSGTTKTYNNLANSYGYGNKPTGSTGMRSSPLNFVRAGYAHNGSLGDRSSSGYGLYWSSTKYTTTNYAYYLDLNASNVSQSYVYRYDGLSLRCVSAS